MNDSGKKDKIIQELSKKIKNGELEYDEIIDLSDSDNSPDVNVAVKMESNKSDNNTSIFSTSDITSQQKTDEKNNVNGSSSLFDEVGNMFKDNKYSKSPKKAGDIDEQINKKDQIPTKNNPKKTDMGKNLEKLKKDVKPVADSAKKVGKELKEQGKQAASKVAGKALNGLTKGIVPPKVGEVVTKKALDKIDKDNQKRFQKIKKKVHNNFSNLKNKINNDVRVQAVKKKAKDTAKKAVKVVKAIKIINFIKKYGAIIAGGLIVFVIIAGVLTVAAVIETYIPGIFGDVKEEVDTVQYSKRDQKILKKIENVVNKYPNVSVEQASIILATVSYPYHELLQDSNVKNYYKDEEDDSEDSIDKTELLFEEDSNLTASEKYEKYKLIFDSGIEAGTKLFKEWLAEKFGYELSDDDEEDDGSPNNDIYLTMYRKDKYIDKFDELMKVYSTKGKEEYEKYLEETYYNSDEGYKNILKNVSGEDKVELLNEIKKDVEENSSLYEVYIPNSCVTSGGSTVPLNGAGNVENIKGNIYVTLKDYYTTNSDGSWEKKSTGKGKFIVDDYYKAPTLYNTDTEPLPFSRYIMGVVYAESESCISTESCAKALMITAKSFAIGRQSTMGYNVDYIESENKSIIYLRGNVGDQDFCDIYEGCETGTFSKNTWQVWNGEGYDNRKGPLSSEKIANLEKWWNEVSEQYVMNKESGKFVGSQYSDYNNNCKQGDCLSQKLLKSSSEEETDYMNLLFNSTNGGFDNTKYVLYTSTNNELYAVTVGNKMCNDGSMTSSRQAIVNFARSMIGKIPYYFYGGQSDNYGALGHALFKNYDDNHFGEVASISDYKGRNKYGLDCSGFVDFVFWNVLNDNLGNGNTDTLKSVSTKIDYSELKPGDLGFLSDGSSGTKQHVGIYIGDDKWVELNPNGVTEGPYPDFKVYYRPNILIELDEKEAAAQGDGITTGEFISPIKGETLTCSDYPEYKKSKKKHRGTDISVPEGTDVLAVDGGVVLESKDITTGDCSGDRRCNGGLYSYGKVIQIKHDNGLITTYGHFSERLVEKGDKVSKGQVIGKSGNTGDSTGPHLHIEVSKNGVLQNPCDYIK